jgi:hypothetical protein
VNCTGANKSSKFSRVLFYDGIQDTIQRERINGKVIKMIINTKDTYVKKVHKQLSNNNIIIK